MDLSHIWQLILLAAAVGYLAFQLQKRKPTLTNDGWPRKVLAKVKGDRVAREEVKRKYGRLFEAVSELMFKHDPIHINYEENTDEYEPEAGTVVPRLEKCRTEQEVCLVLHEEFVKWFGSETAGSRENYEALAADIWSLWKARAQQQVAVGRPRLRRGRP